MKITHEDAALLGRITKSLINNLKTSVGDDAEEKYAKALTTGDIARLVTAKLRIKFNARATDARKLAKARMKMNDAALGPLLRAFGKDTLVNILPAEAASEHVVNLCEELGSPGIADLCRQKIAQTRTTPAAKRAKPTV